MSKEEAGITAGGVVSIGEFTRMKLEKDREIERLKKKLADGAFTGHDPVNDEKVEFTILEFQHNLLAETLQFCQQMKEAGENPQNDEQRILKHTYTDWMNYFRRWASW